MINHPSQEEKEGDGLVLPGEKKTYGTRDPGKRGDESP